MADVECQAESREKVYDWRHFFASCSKRLSTSRLVGDTVSLTHLSQGIVSSSSVLAKGRQFSQQEEVFAFVLLLATSQIFPSGGVVGQGSTN